MKIRYYLLMFVIFSIFCTIAFMIVFFILQEMILITGNALLDFLNLISEIILEEL